MNMDWNVSTNIVKKMLIAVAGIILRLKRFTGLEAVRYRIHLILRYIGIKKCFETQFLSGRFRLVTKSKSYSAIFQYYFRKISFTFI